MTRSSVTALESVGITSIDDGLDETKANPAERVAAVEVDERTNAA